MQILSVNGTKKQTQWQAINWRKANKIVRTLRQRIFRAAQKGDLKKVRSLQKLMLRSYSNTLVSVRRVTQVNAGKHTAGVDKLVVKTPKAREELLKDLQSLTPWKAKPVRRVYIPKARGKLRPLGIPVIKDRCLQAIVKNALESYWEAKFEGSSYGFRPGRSAHDAIVKVHLLAKATAKRTWVVDADIKGAFDNISHDHLLKTIGRVPGRELIKQWMKAGYLEKEVWHETASGTPQGGIISPVLANIALHGMEEALTVYETRCDSSRAISKQGIKYDSRGINIGKRAVVRYADDFLVFCESEEEAQTVIDTLSEWLLQRGLCFSKEKTKIVHLTAGFNFLGFTVKQYKLRHTKRGKKLLITPSKESGQKLRDKLRLEWQSLKGQPHTSVMEKLNPIIRGWANYFRIGAASNTFRKVDQWMFRKQIRFVNHTHPTKSAKWKQAKYWGRLNLNRRDKWVFGDKQTGIHLLRFSWFPIQRHTLVKGNSSPDDASLKTYWQNRNQARIKEVSTSKQRIARQQKGVCPGCGESLFNGEEIHTHHKKPVSQGGTNGYANLQLLHLYCHQQVHATRT